MQPGRQAAYVADARYAPALSGARQSITLDASCLPADGGRCTRSSSTRPMAP
ncbi:MAG: hypothetical protein R3F43_00705 [bacterium]